MALFQLTDEWSLEIGEGFAQRVEDGSLILSDETRAIWVDIFDDNREKRAKIALLKADIAADGAQVWEWEENEMLKFGYLERDEENDSESFELTTFSVAPSGYVLMSFYFEEEKVLDWALKRWRSLRFEIVG